ncbi:MAG: tetratricopeptide repeat protein [Deltaproteobacteria bacterium]|nr:tetratricopeptide repeat protein [Deltaproteobacteria bacterium]
MHAVILAVSQAVAKDPSNLPLRAHLIELYLQSKRLDEALDACRSILFDVPDDARALELAARCEDLRGRDGVAARYRRVLAALAAPVTAPLTSSVEEPIFPDVSLLELEQNELDGGEMPLELEDLGTSRAVPLVPSVEAMPLELASIPPQSLELEPLRARPLGTRFERDGVELPIELDPDAEGVFQLKFDVQPLRVVLGSARARATGVLRFRTRTHSFRLHFSEGSICEVAVLGGGLDASFVHQLVRQELMEESIAARFPAELHGDSARVGGEALGLGVSKPALADATRQWALSMLMRLINARSGACQFVADPVPSPVMPLFEGRYDAPILAWRQGVDPQDLVMDFRALAEHMVTPSERGIVFDELPLEESERAIAHVLMRGAPVRAIMQSAPDPASRTLALKLIHLGLSAQILKLVSPQELAQLQQANAIRSEIRRLSNASQAEILGVPESATKEQVKLRIDELKRAFAAPEAVTEPAELLDAKAELFALYERAVLSFSERFRSAERFKLSVELPDPPPPPIGEPSVLFDPQPVLDGTSTEPTPVDQLRALNTAPMPPPVSPDSVYQASSGPAAFEQMLGALKRGWHADALLFLERAARLDPQSAPRYRAHALYCRALGTSGLDRKSAVAAALYGIQLIIEKDGPFADAFILTGRLKKLTGDRKQATLDFRRALSFEPDNAEALREVHVATGQAPTRAATRTR